MGKKLFYGAILLVLVIAGVLVLNLPKPGKAGQFEWAMNVGKNYLDQGEAAKAVGVFEKAVETNPAHPDGRLNLANALLLNDQPELALIQARGFGLKSMKSRAAETELPLPRYTWEDPYLVLTLYRSPESAAKGLGKGVIAELTQEEQKGWAFLASRTGTTQSEYACNLGVTARTTQFAESAKLEPAIKANLRGLGYGG